MNKIHEMLHTNIRVGRILAVLTSMILFLGCMMIPDMEARAASLSVSVSASSVKIGDSVTVSITVPAGVSATVNLTYPSNLFTFVSASETANANGGTVIMTLGGYGGTNTTTTGTVKFKAKSAGSATFSASAPVAGNQEGDQVSVGGGSASVTVKNEATEKPSGNGNSSNNSGGNSNNNSEDDDEPKSADNSLASLTISEGKLTPAFQYNVVNYSATVDYSVTSVVVSAKVSNAKATIESVKGGENLSVGENLIQIVVKAENGVTATYTIHVTRKAEGEAAEEEPQPEETTDPAEQCYVVNGKTLYPAEAVPQEQIPDGFALSEIMLWEQNYPCLQDTFADQTLRLLYLTEETGENGGWYLVLGSNLYEAYDFVCLRSETGFLIVLPEGDGSTPEGYTIGTYSIADKGMIDAWFFGDNQEFALVYGVNGQGVKGWYQLDLQELTYIRYAEPDSVTSQEQEEEPSTEQTVVSDGDTDTIEGLKMQNRLILGGAVILVIILLIVIIILAVRRSNDNNEDETILDLEDDLGFADNDADAYLNVDRKDDAPGIRKRYDRSAFAGADVEEEPALGKVEIPEEEIPLIQDVAEEEIDSTQEAETAEKEICPAQEAETAEEELPQVDLNAIADPEPMPEIRTHKDEDDEDLEFIDF